MKVILIFFIFLFHSTLVFSSENFGPTEITCRADEKVATDITKKVLQNINRFNNPSGCDPSVNNPSLPSEQSPDSNKSVVNPKPNGKFAPLPNHCFKPIKRNSCIFYGECIEQRLRCARDDLDYAFDYGLKYCQKFLKLRSSVKPAMQEWISNTMQCLQQKFQKFFHKNKEYEGVYIFTQCVPGNASFENTHICNKIRQDAFDSHPVCYLKPKGSFEGGVCNVGHGDWAAQLQMVNLIKTLDIEEEVNNKATAGMFAKQVGVVMAACGLYYTGAIKLNVENKNTTGFTKEQLEKLLRESKKLEVKYKKLAYRLQGQSGGSDTISDAIKYPNGPMLKVEYKKPAGKFEIESGKTLVIDIDTVISVEDLIIGDDVTIILKDGAQLNIKSLRSKIGNNFKIISDSKDGQNGPSKRPPTPGQAGYGKQGVNGTHGKAGESGENASDVELILGRVLSIGSMEVKLQGGDGGDGQSGGHGQKGGGPRCSEDAPPMFGGTGGTAGQGGYPGEGGELRISWSGENSSVSTSEFNSKVSTNTSSGRGGKNGEHGDFGLAGKMTRKCCRWIVKGWCGHYLPISGTMPRNGRWRRWDRNYDWESPTNGPRARVRADGVTDFKFSEFVLTLSSGNKDEFSKIVNGPNYSNSARDVNGDTPLTLLLKSNLKNPIEMYDLIASKNIDVNLLDQKGLSPVQLLIQGDYFNKKLFIEKLVNDGAHLNHEGLLSDSVKTGQFSLVEYLLNKKVFEISELVEAYKIAKDPIRRLLLEEILSRKSNPFSYLKDIYNVSTKKEKEYIISKLDKLKSPLVSEIILDLYEAEIDKDLKTNLFRQAEKRRDADPSDRLVNLLLTSTGPSTLDYVFNIYRNRPSQRANFYKKNILSGNHGVRSRSAKGAGEIKDKSMVNQLLLTLKSETNNEAASSIVWAMGEIGDKKVLPYLKKLRSGDNPYGPSFPATLEKAIVKLESDDARDVDELLKDLHDSSGNFDYSVVTKLAAMGDRATPKVLQSLKTMKETSFLPVGHYLVLGMIGTELAVDGLIGEMNGRTSADFVIAPMNTLAGIRNRKAIPHIRKFLNHPDVNVRDAADAALFEFGENKRTPNRESMKKLNDFKNLLNHPH